MLILCENVAVYVIESVDKNVGIHISDSFWYKEMNKFTWGGGYLQKCWVIIFGVMGDPKQV